MTDLNDAIFKADINTNINTFRQNLQAVYVTRLIEMVVGKSSNRFKVPAKSMAIVNLEKLAKKLKNNRGDLSSRAHKKHLRKLILNALEKI